MTTSLWDQPARYNTVAMILHWLIAAAIIANIVIGLQFADLPRSDPAKFELFSLHRSIGMLVLALSVLRLIWRWFKPAPMAPRGLELWLRIAGRGMHHLFYFLMIAIPLTGWMMISVASQGQPVPVFGLIDLPAFPWLTEMSRADGHAYHEAFETAHVWMAWAMIVLVPLHVLAALYHHFLREDNTLLRMLPGVRLRSGA